MSSEDTSYTFKEAARLLTILKVSGVEEYAQIARLEAELNNELFELHREGVENFIPEVKSLIEEGGIEDSLTGVITERARSLYNEQFVSRARNALRQKIPRIYGLAQTATRRKADGELAPDTPFGSVFDKQAADGPPTIGAGFNVEEQRAIQALENIQVFWMGRHFDENIDETIRQAVREIVFEQGLEPAAAATKLADGLRQELGLAPGARQFRPPSGFKGSFEDYFKGLAMNTATVSRSVGSVVQMGQLGVSQVRWIAVLDERTCVRCRFMHNKTFPMDVMRRHVNQLISANSPAEVKETQPWLSESRFRQITNPGPQGEQDVRNLARLGAITPPLHLRCRCTLAPAPGAPANP